MEGYWPTMEVPSIPQQQAPPMPQAMPQMSLLGAQHPQPPALPAPQPALQPQPQPPQPQPQVQQVAAQPPPSAPAPSSGLPLPPEWSCYQVGTDPVFFYNSVTGERTYKDPRDAVTQVPLQAPAPAPTQVTAPAFTAVPAPVQPQTLTLTADESQLPEPALSDLKESVRRSVLKPGDLNRRSLDTVARICSHNSQIIGKGFQELEQHYERHGRRWDRDPGDELVRILRSLDDASRPSRRDDRDRDRIGRGDRDRDDRDERDRRGYRRGDREGSPGRRGRDDRGREDRYGRGGPPPPRDGPPLRDGRGLPPRDHGPPLRDGPHRDGPRDRFGPPPMGPPGRGPPPPRGHMGPPRGPPLGPRGGPPPRGPAGRGPNWGGPDKPRLNELPPDTTKLLTEILAEKGQNMSAIDSGAMDMLLRSHQDDHARVLEHFRSNIANQTNVRASKELVQAVLVVRPKQPPRQN